VALGAVQLGRALRSAGIDWSVVMIPDGKTAYVVNSSGTVPPISVARGTAASPLTPRSELPLRKGFGLTWKAVLRAARSPLSSPPTAWMASEPSGDGCPEIIEMTVPRHPQMTGHRGTSEGAAVLAVVGHRIAVGTFRPVGHVGNLPPVAADRGLSLRAVQGMPAAARSYRRQLTRREREIGDRALVQADLSHTPPMKGIVEYNKANLLPEGWRTVARKISGFESLTGPGF
jgi:hypothetical protein